MSILPRRFERIKSVLDFEPSIEAGKILKASILKKAALKANEARCGPTSHRGGRRGGVWDPFDTF